MMGAWWLLSVGFVFLFSFQPLKQSAFGAPGIPARWTSSAKSRVGTAIGVAGRVWFTLSHGIFYCPRTDQACLRDLGLIVTERRGVLLRGEA